MFFQVFWFNPPPPHFLDDAERMNAYWNQHDHMAPELQEPNCIKMSQNHERWCQFKVCLDEKNNFLNF